MLIGVDSLRGGLAEGNRILSKNLHSGNRELALQVADLGFKIPQKSPKKALFLAVWVPSMSLEVAICIPTNLDDEKTLLTAV